MKVQTPSGQGLSQFLSLSLSPRSGGCVDPNPASKIVAIKRRPRLEKNNVLELDLTCQQPRVLLAQNFVNPERHSNWQKNTESCGHLLGLTYIATSNKTRRGVYVMCMIPKTRHINPSHSELART